MSTDDQGTTRVRTSDAERERIAETLRNAVAEGRLSLEEGDERLAALYTTRFRDELPTLVADLPKDDGQRWPGPGWGGYRSGGPGWGGPGPGWGGPGSGGPGSGGPGWNGPGSGGPGWGGRGGPGWGGPRPGHWLRWRLLRVVVAVAIIGGLVTLAGGHFLWPIIPLLFLTFGLLRLGAGHCGGRPHGRYGTWAGNEPAGTDPAGRGPAGRAS